MPISHIFECTSYLESISTCESRSICDYTWSTYLFIVSDPLIFMLSQHIVRRENDLYFVHEPLHICFSMHAWLFVTSSTIFDKINVIHIFKQSHLQNLTAFWSCFVIYFWITAAQLSVIWFTCITLQYWYNDGINIIHDIVSFWYTSFPMLKFTIETIANVHLDVCRNITLVPNFAKK